MPSYVIGLDLGSSGVKAAVLKGSFRGYEVEDFLDLGAADFGDTADMPSPAAEHHDQEEEDDEYDDEEDGESVEPAAATAATGDLLPAQPLPPSIKAAQRVLGAVDAPQALIVTAVPAHRASSWLLDLPFSDRKRIDQTIGFEVENYVPWDLEEVVLDYDIVSTGSEGAHVFAAMVPRERIAELLGWLADIEVDPRDIAVDAAELSRLVPISEECEVVLDIGATRTLMCIVLEGRTRWIRSLDLGADSWGEDGDLTDWLRQVRASLLAAEESGAPSIDAVLLTGGGSQREDLLDLLHEDLGVPVELLELPESPVNTDMSPRPGPEHALAYALALKGFGDKARGDIGFRREEFAWKADSRLYTRLAMAGIAAVLLLFVGFIVMHFLTMADLQKRLETANAHLTSTVQTAFPEVSPTQLMTPDGSIGVMQEQVYALQGKAQALEGPPMTALESMREISNALPSARKVDVDEYLVNTEMIRLRGKTDSYGTGEALEADALGSEKFPGAEVSDLNKARDGSTTFILTIPRYADDPEG
ncbi:MAG: pilus assembly protein PilM [Proteobacteria bacterium]|nr:pilus assembly protein PilM [Pseudomonadota bacterium]